MKNKGAPFLHVSHADITREEIEAAVSVLRSGWLTMGEKTFLLEEKLAHYLKANYVVAVNACTSALHLSLLASGVGEGDEVITSPNTFAATANVILFCRAKPVFVDIDSRTGNINADLIENAVTEKTKAIIPVHFAGHPCEMDKIERIARKYKLSVIEDAAHALGAEFRGKKIGSLSDFTCFSFYAAKNLTTIEGGAIALKNKKHLALLQKLRLHGLSRTAWSRYRARGVAKYAVEVLGYKYNLNDVAAAIGLVQLRRYEKLQKKRARIAEYYLRKLQEVEEITLPYVAPHIKHSWHIFVIRCKRATLRDQLADDLKKKNIGTAFHFVPLHLQPLYRRKIGTKHGLCPEAEAFGRSCLTIPLHPAMSLKDARRVVEAIKAFFQKRKPCRS